MIIKQTAAGAHINIQNPKWTSEGIIY